MWLGYAGTLGTSYDLPLVFDALKRLGISNLRFIVMGNGPLKNKFKKQAENLNVTFTGYLPYEQMCGALVACDIVVNPIVESSAASIINKHADYAASGKPVLNTQKSQEYRKLIENYQMGFNCSNEKEAKLEEGLLRLVSDKKLRIRMGENARRCAEERFDRKRTYGELKKEVFGWMYDI